MALMSVRCVLAWFLLLLFPAAAAAQTVEGTVSDPQGVAVPGVLVELTAAGGAVRTTWTDADGRYRFAGVAPGKYTLQALSADFENASAEVQVTADDTATVGLQFAELRRSQTWIEVVGEPTQALREIPGSVALVSKQELEDSHPIDANEVLRRVPGVTLREDSGPVAMRINMAIRGLNPDRSRTVLMLEDGLPIALAPYGEPEMYYSPPIDRMKRVEVLKGSGQIVHGPRTVGGVVNFVSLDPPPSLHGELDISGGQRGFFAANGAVGSSNRDQTFGWLLTGLVKRGEGFRDFFYDIYDTHAKVTVKPAAAHQLSFKFGWYDEGSNSTYLGLTTPMFLADAGQNAVPGDRLFVKRYSGSLLHSYTINSRAVLASSFYGYNTSRNWERQDFDRSDQGRDYVAIAGDPGVPGGAVFLRDSSGHRNRMFTVFGAQSNLTVEHTLGGKRGRLDAGVRYLSESHDDSFLVSTPAYAPPSVVRDDEERFGRAFSAYLQNRFFLTDKLIFTPGVRLEYFRYTRHILRQRVDGVPTDVDIRTTDAVTQAIPGVGLSYQVHPVVTLFGGVHRGFAPPRTKTAITADGESLDLDAELSWNYEAGVRFGPHRAVTGEVTFFRLDFDNQIIPAAQSGGATTTLVNAGETLNQGLESSLRVNWNELLGGPLVVYTDVRYLRLTEAKFTRNTLFQDNRLPYAPGHTFSVLLGVRQREGFGMQVDMSHVTDQFADNGQTVTASGDGTVGLIPAYTLWNLSTDYTFRRERYSVRPYLTIKNLGNRVYIASRAPQGIQPGLFRQLNAGLRFVF